MIMGFDGVNPKISKSAYISESVDILGNVEINENANKIYENRHKFQAALVLGLFLIG